MGFQLDQLSTYPAPSPFIGSRSRSISKRRDFEDGGIALNDTSQGLLYQQWRAILINNQVLLTSATQTTPVVILSATGIEEISFSFDQDMRHCLAYVQNGNSKFLWYDPDVAEYVTIDLPSGTITPRVALDDKRPEFIDNSDIILAYVRDNNLYFRKQSDKFLTEYLLSTAVNYGLTKIGMGTALRFQFEFDLFHPAI